MYKHTSYLPSPGAIHTHTPCSLPSPGATHTHTHTHTHTPPSFSSHSPSPTLHYPTKFNTSISGLCGIFHTGLLGEGQHQSPHTDTHTQILRVKTCQLQRSKSQICFCVCRTWMLRCCFSLLFPVLLQWHVQATCATQGTGLYEGLDWLSNELSKR